MRAIIAVILCVVSSLALAQSEKPKNVIMVVGDGMGPAYTTAYRYFSDDKSNSAITKTVFDRNLTGMASTYPARVSGYVTDSAAGATALSSGHKSYNGAIAVDEDKEAVLTVLEWAKKQGKKTGVAVTSQINHATPAAFSSHNESRHNYNEIADSYFDDKVDGKFALDVMLGGGWKFFLREDRDLVSEFKKAGYQYIDVFADLANLKGEGPLLGLFGDEGMPLSLDMPNRLRLPTLTQTAIKRLENPNGFFLLVEGSQVDWAGHSNDIAWAMAEMHDLAKTMEFLEAYVQQHPDTLVVLTADHSTGGLTIAASGEYRWSPDVLKNLSASPYMIATALTQSDKPLEEAEKMLGFELSQEDKAQLSETPIGDQKAVYVTLKKIIDRHSNTGWTTSGHTGVDVQVFAMGMGSEQFAGHVDNTEIPKRIFKLLGK